MTICKFKKCSKYACYNFEGLKSKFCKEHKSQGMVNVKSKKCEFKNCLKYPSYNYKNEKPIFCKEHKSEGMVDVKSKICEYENCYIQPQFNFSNCKSGKFCYKHKLDFMVNVKCKKCNHNNCNKQPQFNFSIEKKGLYCFDHKLDSMVNIYEKRRCQYINCTKRPSFNFENKEKSIFCSKHKLNGMINVIHTKCNYEKCNKIPSFNYENEKKGKFCLEHKLENMVDIVHKKCVSNFCKTIVTKNKYDNYCTHCFSNLFPDDPRTLQIRKKSKELKVISFIANKIEGFLHDKPLYVDLKGGCCNSKRRIDLRKLINGTLLCMEIDENQHKYYNQEDENNRYDNLFMDFSGKYIFIRYNPDKYSEGEKTKNPRFETRMKTLIQEIERQTKRIENYENKNLIEIVKLFYDN